MSAQPKFIDPLPEVPTVMKDKRQWVRWRLETRHGKQTKVPYRVDGKPAASDNPNDWTDYYTAVSGVTINKDGGVGFMFADGFAGIDLDGCHDPKTGEITWWAQEIIQRLDGVYVELSPSGTGLHIFVMGTVPGADKKFNLNPEIGHGKAAIEIYDTRRYFTVTGQPYFNEAGDVSTCDLTEVYELLHKIRKENPAPRNDRADAADVREPTKVQWLGTLHTNKYEILKKGEILNPSGPFRISDGYGVLEYPSQSEADLAFCTVLAIMHGDDADKIWDEYTESSLVREKWLNRKDDFIRLTIGKAIGSAKRVKDQQTPAATAIPLQQPEAAAGAAEDASRDVEGTFPYGDNEIPPFDPSVVNGIYKRFVDVATRGTTMAPQFVYTIAKTIVGARMAGKVTFENLDVEPRIYAALIGESGSGKGEAWRRVFQILNVEGQIGNIAGLKIINSADSGAGIRDAFFENPQEAPMIMYIDEVESFGNKGSATRNPAIIDMLIELADSTHISVVKAKKGKAKGTKTKNDARLCTVMCGQEGSVYMKAFAGRTKLGLWDRLTPEYGVAVEAGDMPHISTADAYQLLAELNNLNYSGKMTMADDAKSRLESFWVGQPPAVRKKARWKKNLALDAYMSAFGRGSKVAELEDVEIAIRIFTRQLVIRQTQFTSEVPDRIGYYLGLLKAITARMEKQLAAGLPEWQVAKSRRDYEKETHAHRDNEGHLFDRAWAVYAPTWLEKREVKKANGHAYWKYVPATDE
jgi:putative DNA primase/helicase